MLRFRSERNNSALLRFSFAKHAINGTFEWFGDLGTFFCKLCGLR